jgi:disulfide bond formation protein DsbB
MTLVETVNFILGILTIAGDGMILGMVAIYVSKIKSSLLTQIAKNAIWMSFVIALISTLGSLFYSEIAGYEPCKLCWYQRILMYPLVIILGIAWKRNDKKIVDYALALSGLGAIIAGYHYYLQLGGKSVLPCSAVGYSVSCSQRFVMSFGYITIPMMALTSFLLIFLLLWRLREKNKK